MKKLILPFFMLLISITTLNAQKMWVGGTAGLLSSHTNGDDKSDFSFQLMPEFGINLSNNIALGIALGGGHTNALEMDNFHLFYDGIFMGTSSTRYSANTYKVNPFVRYSIKQNGLGSLFFDGGVGYAYTKVCGEFDKSYALELGVRPGISINLSSRFALIGKFGFLGYEHIRTKNTVWEYNISSWDLPSEMEGLEFPPLRVSKLQQRENRFGFDFNLNNIQLGGVFKF